MSFAVLLWSALLGASPARCPAGFEAVDSDACVLLPKGRAPAPLLVYFHGMLPPAVDWATVPELRALGAEAARRGFALVAMRGEPGLCNWGKDVKDWFCWPSDLSQRPAIDRTLARVEAVLSRLAARGAQLGPPFLAGFSNGGYFVSMIASESKLEARGYAVLHAGNVTGQQFPPTREKPTLLVGARADAIQLPTMKRLETLLGEAGWKPVFSLRDGVHELTPEDAKAVGAFVAGLP